MKLVLTPEEFDITIWAIKNIEYYRQIQSNIPAHLWAEYDEEWGYYYPLYFPVGLLIKFLKEKGYNIEIIY